MRAHLVADVPVGVFLSGGIDSSAIVSAARSIGATGLQSFTVAFDDVSSESRFARTVASAFGTTHHELRLEAPHVVDDLPRILARLDQPTIDAVNSYYVSKAVAATGIKTVLSGTGGDELFGGYPSFTRLPRAMAFARAAGRLLPAVAPLVAMALPARLRPRWRSFAVSNGRFGEAYRAQRGFLLPEEVDAIAGPALRDDEAAWRAVETVGAVEQSLMPAARGRGPLRAWPGSRPACICARSCFAISTA